MIETEAGKRIKRQKPDPNTDKQGILEKILSTVNNAMLKKTTSEKRHFQEKSKQLTIVKGNLEKEIAKQNAELEKLRQTIEEQQEKRVIRAYP